MKNGNTLVLAKIGENLAASLLTGKSYEILHQNFHSRYGEIDIIARTQTHIIFTEVKTRRDLDRDRAIESVTSRKQRRIEKTALHYLFLHPEYQEYMVRFDIVLVFYHRATNNYSFEHIEDAFSFSGIG